MPKTPDKIEVADKLKPFVSLGVNLLSEQGDEALAECPFCGKEKLYINTTTGVWSCRVCQTGSKKGGGNIFTFLKVLWESSEVTGLESLAREKKLLDWHSLKQWGIRSSLITGEIILPGWNQEGKIVNIYRYSHGKMLSTEGLHHGLFGMNLFDPKREYIYLCEGWADPIALWEVLKGAKYTNDGGLTISSSIKESLTSNINVLGVPGCNVFHESWNPLFEKKHVSLLFDSDHPKEKTPPSGFTGMKRVSGFLAHTAGELHYIDWGGEGKGYDASLPTGFDVRDHLLMGRSLRERIERYNTLTQLIKPVPAEWLEVSTAKTKQEFKIELIKCTLWKELLNQWKKTMKMTEGLERALAFIMALGTSTNAVGAQLWGMLLSCASSGKTTLVEGAATDKKHVIAKDTFTGFHSGYNDGTDEDHSPITEMFGKLVIIKEADTILSNDNCKDIMAELRAIWDRTFRNSKKIKSKSNNYFGNMTVLMCGTSKLYQLDSSESGARFLTCSVMDSIDDELEDEVLDRVMFQAVRNMAFESNGDLKSQYDPERLKAMQMTGGYMEYLRENAHELLSSVEVDRTHLESLKMYAKFVAYLRARPSKVQDEAAEREFAPRLAEQMTRLAMCTAVVMNKSLVDSTVMKLVKQVALDTARGRTLDMMKWLRKSGTKGLEPRGLANYLGEDTRKTEPMLFFLQKIRAIEVFNETLPYGMVSQPRYRLTPYMTRLYDSVMGKS